MKTALLLLLLLPLTSLADGFAPAIPTLWHPSTQDPRYRDAAAKAQEALLIQSGFTQDYNRFGRYIAGATTSTISSETPLDPRTVYVVVGAAYAVAVKRQVKYSFSDPLWPQLRHTFKVSADAASAGMSLAF